MFYSILYLGKVLSNSSASLRGLVLVGTAVTPVHPGAGRAPGIVDLPVTRDALGYPVIYASEVKGAFKSMCARKHGGGECVLDDEGRIKCSECKVCCCLFGPEPGEGDAGSSLLAFLDFIPLAFPVPSADYGYLYVSSTVLLRKISLILDALGYSSPLSQAINALLSKDPPFIILNSKRSKVSGGSTDINVAGTSIRATVLSSSDEGLNTLKDERVNEVFEKLGGLSKDAVSKLLVLDEKNAVAVIEKGLLRVTRVRIRRDRKVVAERALWTEEYIPAGTIFVGGVVAMETRNAYCKDTGIGPNNAVEKFKELMLGKSQGQKEVTYVLIGGKETVGRGIIKLIGVTP